MNNNNIQIRYALNTDKDFWGSLDKHLSASEFEKKIRDKQGYILLVDNRLVGLLRYNLFWDNTPFCTLLHIDENYQRKGLGTKLMKFWENDMCSLGYKWLLVSTQSDESAQHFYRSLGYNDCGYLVAPNQAAELFLCKYFNNQFENTAPKNLDE